MKNHNREYKKLDRLKVGTREIFRGLMVYCIEYPKGDQFHRNIVPDLVEDHKGKKWVHYSHPDSDAPFGSGLELSDFIESYTW